MKHLLALAFLLFVHQILGGVVPDQENQLHRVRRTIDTNSTKEIFEDLSRILQVRFCLIWFLVKLMQFETHLVVWYTRCMYLK